MNGWTCPCVFGERPIHLGGSAQAEIGSTSEVDIGTWLIGLGMLAFVQLLQGGRGARGR